jgi:hypothetical protein
MLNLLLLLFAHEKLDFHLLVSSLLLELGQNWKSRCKQVRFSVVDAHVLASHDALFVLCAPLAFPFSLLPSCLLID